MEWGALFVGIAAIVTAAGGCALVIREFRKRDRREMQRVLDESSFQLAKLQGECMEVRVRAFKLAGMLADMGVVVPEHLVEPEPLP